MDSNERIRRGDGELVAREPVDPVIEPIARAVVSRHARIAIPPPPPTRLRPPTSWLR